MIKLTADQALANSAAHHALPQPGESITAIASDIVGLHNTSQPTPYLSLRARLAGFEREDLEDEMWGSWRLARIRAMRLTMFVFPHDLMEIAAAATRHIAEPFGRRWLRDSEFSRKEFDRLARAVDEALAERPMTVRALRKELAVDTGVNLSGVVGRLCDLGVLVGGAPPRNWRSSVRQYHRWRDVLPDVDLHRWDEGAAVRELLRRYICSYGPVTIDDISWWTGITKGRCREAIKDLHDDVEEVKVDGWPGPLYRVTDRSSDTDPGAEVKALPLLDPYVQGYRDRQRFLDPGRHDFVYDGGGNSAATLVCRGRIIGVWQVSEDPGESVRYHLFADVSASQRRRAEAELAAAGSLYFDRPVDVTEIATMKPLSADGGRSAFHPLDDRLHRSSQSNQKR